MKIRSVIDVKNCKKDAVATHIIQLRIRCSFGPMYKSVRYAKNLTLVHIALRKVSDKMYE